MQTYNDDTLARSGETASEISVVRGSVKLRPSRGRRFVSVSRNGAPLESDAEGYYTLNGGDSASIKNLPGGADSAAVPTYRVAATANAKISFSGCNLIICGADGSRIKGVTRNGAPVDPDDGGNYSVAATARPVKQTAAETASCEAKKAAKPAKEDEVAVSAEPERMTVELTFGEKLSRFLKAEQGWLFVAPAIILMCVFTFYPIISTFVNAFKQNYNSLVGTYDGWGFENFVRVLTSKANTGSANFTQCLVNTLIFTFISVPLSTLLALLISVALNSIKVLQKAYQTILFLPYLTNSLAMGAVFASFFQIVGTNKYTYTYGIVNDIIRLFFGEGSEIDWMGTRTALKWTIGDISIPWTKYIVVVVYEIWSGLPFKILILFSSLQSVNKQYYDAARIDGATKSTILWKITTPLIMPMISYLLITGIMGGMKQYSAIVGLFGEDMGENYDMGTMVGFIYKSLDTPASAGYAYAGSIVLFIIIMIITLINLRVSKKRVTY